LDDFYITNVTYALDVVKMESGESQFMQFRTVLLLIFLAVMPLAIYWPTLNNYFLNSDFPQILYTSNALAEPGLLLHEFSDSWFGSHDFELYFRPLPIFFMAFNLTTSGVNPFGYHLLSLGIHILCVWCVFLFTRELIPSVVNSKFDSGRSETSSNAQMKEEKSSNLLGMETSWDATPIAFWSAALFAVYPINAEAINWVGGRPDCSAGLFAVLALYFWLKEQNTGNRNFGIGAMVSYLVALFCKETPIGIVFIPALLCLFKTGSWSLKLANGFRSSWKLLVALLIYILMRWHALGTVFGGYKGTEWKLLATGEYLSRWSEPAFLQKLIFPFNIALPLAHPVNSVFAGLYVLVLVLALSDLSSWKSRLKIVAVCFVFWFIAILPEWRTAMMTHTLAGGRSFYLASVPFCLTISALLFPLVKVPGWRASASHLVAAILVGTFCFTDYFNNKVWNESASTTKAFQNQLANLIEKTPKLFKILVLNPPLSIEGNYGLNQALVAVTQRPPFVPEDNSNRVLCLDREHYGARDANLINATSLRQSLLASPVVTKWNPESKMLNVIELIPDTMPVTAHNIIVESQPSDYPGCTSFKLLIDPAINPLSCEAIEVSFKSEGTAKPGYAILGWDEYWKRSPTDVYKREVQCDVNGDAKLRDYRFPVAEQTGWYANKKIEELNLNIYNVNKVSELSAKLASDAYFIPRIRPDLRFFTRTAAGLVPGTQGAVFICDTEVDGATGMFVELSQRNECFETYTMTYRDKEPSKEASKRMMAKGRSATFNIPLSDVGPGFWCVRVASLDAKNSIVGAFSDPVIFRIEDTQRALLGERQRL
jgi:hypothetical protein